MRCDAGEMLMAGCGMRMRDARQGVRPLLAAACLLAVLLAARVRDVARWVVVVVVGGRDEESKPARSWRSSQRAARQGAADATFENRCCGEERCGGCAAPAFWRWRCRWRSHTATPRCVVPLDTLQAV
jgi:hypothetical protein